MFLIKVLHIIAGSMTYLSHTEKEPQHCVKKLQISGNVESPSLYLICWRFYSLWFSFFQVKLKRKKKNQVFFTLVFFFSICIFCLIYYSTDFSSSCYSFTVWTEALAEFLFSPIKISKCISTLKTQKHKI